MNVLCVGAFDGEARLSCLSPHGFGLPMSRLFSPKQHPGPASFNRNLFSRQSLNNVACVYSHSLLANTHYSKSVSLSRRADFALEQRALSPALRNC